MSLHGTTCNSVIESSHMMISTLWQNKKHCSFPEEFFFHISSGIKLNSNLKSTLSLKTTVASQMIVSGPPPKLSPQPVLSELWAFDDI